MRDNKQLIMMFAGKKGSGKSSSGKYVFVQYVNAIAKTIRLVVNKKDEVIDLSNDNCIIPIDIPFDQNTVNVSEKFGIKLYSFADPLKKFLHDVFGISLDLLYGNDVDKNTKTHVMWDNMPPNICVKYSRPKRGTSEHQPAYGAMTIRELLQVIGTDICRSLDEGCWARALYSKIKEEKYKVAIITDARFLNEITIGSELGAKIIRLMRSPYKDNHASESSLDNIPLGEYSEIIDNTSMSIDARNQVMMKSVKIWLNEL